MRNALYYGDNLEVLREQVADASVDLIYFDPPFNSNASYNVLSRAPSGGPDGSKGANASIEAFDDTGSGRARATSAGLGVRCFEAALAGVRDRARAARRAPAHRRR